MSEPDQPPSRQRDTSFVDGSLVHRWARMQGIAADHRWHFYGSLGSYLTLCWCGWPHIWADVLDISRNLEYTLQYADIVGPEQIAQMSDHELLQCHGIGPATLKRLRTIPERDWSLPARRCNGILMSIQVLVDHYRYFDWHESGLERCEGTHLRRVDRDNRA